MWSPRQVTHLPLCGVFYFPWHRHQIEGTNGFYCLIRKTERFTISNVESQVITPNNSRLPRGLNAGGPRPKRVSYHCVTTVRRRSCFVCTILTTRYPKNWSQTCANIGFSHWFIDITQRCKYLEEEEDSEIRGR